MDGSTKQYVVPGQRVRLIAPYSEVNMHMGIAGKPVEACLYESRSADYVYHGARYFKDGQPWTTVTYGEGGFYREDVPMFTSVSCGENVRLRLAEDDHLVMFYTYPDDDGNGDDDPRQVAEDIIRMLDEATRGHDVMVITNLGLG